LPEEIAPGVTLGYALEALTFIPAHALGAPLLWTAIDFFGTHALTLPAITTSSVDMHAHLAAADWITGVEPLVLLSCLAALVVLLGAVGRRITDSRGGALAALAGTAFVASTRLSAITRS
jgi:hypothetical protein